MGRRDLLLGLVVLAAIATGVYLTRGPGPQAPSGSAADHADLPDLSLADARLEVGDVAVQVEVPARPIVAFEPNLLLFHFVEAGAPDGDVVAVEEPAVSFTMKMDMGKNRYALVPAARPGWLQAEFVLPACPSGGRRWYGILTFRAGGREREARFQFGLVPGDGGQGQS